MAITKLMHMKSAKSGKKGSHLKNAIDYILKTEKVATEGDYKYQESCGCSINNAYREMINTKEAYGKTDGRQGYHFVISFKPGEVTKEQLWKITQGFVNEYLTGYEVVYAMHDDADHLHAHIIFNSVSYRTGYKYHYKNGDWEKDIQPIVDKLCLENGAPVLKYHVDEMDFDGKQKEIYTYSKRINWTTEVKEDIDNCISVSRNWTEFVANMKDIGYRFNTGKYITVRKPGMKKAKRLKEKTMGFAYTPEGIVERINFRMGNARLTIRAPNLNYKRTPENIRTAVRYKKYKQMSFNEKVLVRHMLRIKNAIPEYKNYPGSWFQKRKSDELQRVSQELVIIKKYGIHSISDMKKVCKDLSSEEKKIKDAAKTEDLRMEQLQVIISAYNILEKDNGNNTEEEKKRARKVISKANYNKTTIDKYVSEYEINSEIINTRLKEIKRQKLVLVRLMKKYEDKTSEKNINSRKQVKEAERNGRNRIN